jgi:hypothetical protein
MLANGKNPHTDGDTSPTRSVHHDVLVINPNHELYRFNVQKTDSGRKGEYVGVEYQGSGAPGYRKVTHIARKGADESPRGAAFATLPVKEEPASSFMCCYLVNSENLTYRNVWTQAEWNDAPNTGGDGLMHEAHDRDIRLLVAEHGGRVLYLNIPKEQLANAEAGWELGPVEDGSGAGLKPISLKAISLKDNPEIWNLLRNGCVAGSAVYRDAETPLLNLTSLLPAREEDHHEIPDEQKGGNQITGTLDFKWSRRPKDSQREADVLVGFLPVAEGVYGVPQRELFKLFEKYARTWALDELGLEVAFKTDAAFEPDAAFDYDVLVSLAPLDGSVLDHEGKPVLIPASELGSYARRVDRGAATFFAGLPKGLKKDGQAEMLPSEYPRSKAFQQFVVHEFGHSLGLTHLHQHPRLAKLAKEQLRSDLELDSSSDAELEEKVRTELKEELGLEVPENYFEEGIGGVWPGPEKYSEWPAELKEGKNEARALKKFLNESIMIGLAGRAPDTMGKISARDCRTAPGAVDLAWLKSLYPKRRGAPPGKKAKARSTKVSKARKK